MSFGISAAHCMTYTVRERQREKDRARKRYNCKGRSSHPTSEHIIISHSTYLCPLGDEWFGHLSSADMSDVILKLSDCIWEMLHRPSVVDQAKHTLSYNNTTEESRIK